ncbi:MAG: ankyrin repeat domain-containing protein [Leptospiraceae bacterium]|nr:ankyrin repeat domain-containing protein [Leptospiraceae bacterium]
MKFLKITLLSLFLFSNCYTLSQLNSQDKNKIYGGTRSIFNYSSHPHNPFGGIFKFIGYVSLPFNFALDTAILPFTIPHYYITRNPYTKVFKKIKENDIEYVKKKIESGYPIDTEDDNGKTGLMLATSFGNFEMVKLFVENKADVNFKSYRSETAFSISLRTGNEKIQDYLIQNGIIVNPSTIGNSIKYGVKENTIIKLLAKIESCSEEEFNNWLKELAFTDYITLANKIFEKSYAINDPKKLDIKALVLSTRTLNSKMIQLLINKGMDVNYKTSVTHENLNLLTLKFNKDANNQKKLFDTIKVLTKLGVQVNEKNSENENALHYLTQSFHQNTEIVKFFVSKGLDFNSPNKVGYSPLMNSILYKQKETFDFFLSKKTIWEGKKGKSSLLGIAAYNDDSYFFDKLVTKVKDINFPGHMNRTPLIKAALNNNFSNIDTLLEKGANPTLKDTDGKTLKDYLTDELDHSNNIQPYSEGEKLRQKEIVKNIKRILERL